MTVGGSRERCWEDGGWGAEGGMLGARDSCRLSALLLMINVSWSRCGQIKEGGGRRREGGKVCGCSAISVEMLRVAEGLQAASPPYKSLPSLLPAASLVSGFSVINLAFPSCGGQS